MVHLSSVRIGTPQFLYVCKHGWERPCMSLSNGWKMRENMSTVLATPHTGVILKQTPLAEEVRYGFCFKWWLPIYKDRTFSSLLNAAWQIHKRKSHPMPNVSLLCTAPDTTDSKQNNSLHSWPKLLGCFSWNGCRAIKMIICCYYYYFLCANSGSSVAAPSPGRAAICMQQGKESVSIDTMFTAHHPLLCKLPFLQN